MTGVSIVTAQTDAKAAKATGDKAKDVCFWWGYSVWWWGNYKVSSDPPWSHGGTLRL
ncbi:MAG: hypothetical protein JSR78_09235 [Proteobacteria bacterium]|nr:hypothetical protein [Pseudomonadota bacterium]